MIRSVAFEKTDQFQSSLEDLKTAETIRPANYGVDLDRALTFYRQGREQDAFDALDSAVGKGWTNLALIEKDRDFNGLVAHPRFQSLREKLVSLK
jgi:hypothetical protein